jgi:hypothetical protein
MDFNIVVSISGVEKSRYEPISTANISYWRGFEIITPRK